MPTAVDASSTKVNNIGITCQIDQNGTATFQRNGYGDEATEGIQNIQWHESSAIDTSIGVTDLSGNIQKYRYMGFDVSRESKINNVLRLKMVGHYELCFGQ